MIRFATACGVVLGLVPQQPGPWDNDLILRVSLGGRPFGAESTFVVSAGVPNLLRTASGRLYAAFQWFPQEREAFDRVAICWSDDNGKTWSKPKTAIFDGLPETYQRPFDPTLVATEGGKIRMFFTSNQRGEETTAIYSAISSDGIRFKFEPGARLAVSGRRVVDSAALKLGKAWHLIAPIGRPEDGAYHATSTDGLHFVRQADIASVNRANWTGNLVAAKPGMCFYGSSERGLWWSYSKDGKTWTDPNYLNIQGGDPGVANGLDGRVFLMYVSPPRRFGG